MKKENDRSGAWAKDRIFLGALGALLVLFHWKVLFQAQVYAALDSSRFFFPVWKWGWGVFEQGHIPLWNPAAQFGVPHLADPQTACAYLPLWFLYLLLGPVTGFSMVIVLHHLWALWGTWTFARSQGFSPRASFLGSVTFGFSLHLVGSSWTPPALMAISWLPWVFWAAERVFRKERGGFLFLSLTWAMQLACGYPVLTYLTGLGIGAHYLWKSVPVREFTWVLRFLTAAMVAASYNLAWGLPFAEMLPLTNYSEGASKFHDLGWKDLMSFLSPFSQGHPLEPNDQTTPYWVGSFYLGLPILGLLVWGGWRRAFRRTSPWLFLLFLILSLGWLGVGKVLRVLLPGYSLVVHSGFWISILALYGVWMAMEAMDKLLGEQRKAGPWVWGALTLVTLLTLAPMARGLLLTKDRSFYTEPPKVLAKLDKPGRIFFTPPEMARSVRVEGRDIGEAYEAAKQDLVPNWPLAFGREVAPYYNTLQLKATQAWTFDAFRRSEDHSRKMLDRLGFRYVSGKTRFGDLRPVAGTGISENPTTHPKWLAVPKSPTRSVREGERWPCLIGIGVEGKGRCLVLSSETAYPGWKALVLRAGRWEASASETIDGSFRGIALEEGEERVLFSYEPTSFRLGLFLSLLICGLWMGSFLRRLRP